MKTELNVVDLVRGADNDQFALPFFQRDYVWEKKDVATFLDSMSRDWPAGSIILWDKPGVHGRRFGSFKGNPAEVTTDQLVLDGQQRITTLLLLRQGGRIDLPGPYGKSFPTYFFFDLEDGEFTASRDDRMDAGRYIDVRNILRGKMSIRGIPRKYRRTQKQKTILRRLTVLPRYTFPVVHTSVASEEDAIEVFNRVNTTGKKVDKLELAFAHLRDKEHEVSRRITRFQTEWVREGFDLTPRVLINSFLIVLNINDKDYYVRTRGADTQIREYLANSPRILTDWHNVFDRMNSALTFLKRFCWFDSDQFLPTENAIAALAGYFERNDLKPYQLSSARVNGLKRWLFRTMLFGRYAKTTNFEQDLRDLQDDRRLPEPTTRGQNYSEDGLIALMYAIGRSRRMTDFRGEEITWAATMRAGRVIHVDHVYPFSRLTKEPISKVASARGDRYGELADDVGNKAFAVGESNTSKNRKFPGEEARATGQWMDGFDFLGEDDYRKMEESENAAKRGWGEVRSFIQERRIKILKDIKREVA